MMSGPGSIDHWYEVVVWLTLIIIGPGGGVLIANAISGRKRKHEREKETEKSVDLHRQIFDDSVEKLEARLRDHIAKTVRPLSDRQAQMCRQQAELVRDFKTLDHKIDTNAKRHDRLEKDTYAAIAKAERVIAKHHPEEE